MKDEPEHSCDLKDSEWSRLLGHRHAARAAPEDWGPENASFSLRLHPRLGRRLLRRGGVSGESGQVGGRRKTKAEKRPFGKVP